jgi:hypothetical protein
MTEQEAHPPRVELYTNGWERLVWLRVMPMDPVFGERIFLREIAATAKLGRDISGARFRRVFSIAQRREAMGIVHINLVIEERVVL